MAQTLGMAAGVEQASHLPPRPLGQAQEGLPQHDAGLLRSPVHPLDRAQQQVAVGGVGHGLGRHRRVDGDPLHLARRHRPGLRRHRDRLGQQNLELLRPDPTAPARHRGAVERQLVAEEFLAAEGLEVRVFDPLGADLLVGQALDVLEQVQARHQPGRQGGTAAVLVVERAEGVLEALPVDQPRQPDQLVTAVDHGLEPHPEEIVVGELRGSSAAWRSSCRGAVEPRNHDPVRAGRPLARRRAKSQGFADQPPQTRRIRIRSGSKITMQIRGLGVLHRRLTRP